MAKRIHKSLYPRPVEAPGERPLNYCGMRCTLEVLGGKWKMLVMVSLVGGPKRYGELKRAIPEISEKMLIASLRELEEHGLLIRTACYDEMPPKVAYSLSAYGQETIPLLRMLYDWGEEHIRQYSHVIFHATE